MFSVIVLINFSWSIGRIFYFLPSWLYFMTILEILPVLAYVLGFALLESLFILFVILGLAFVLPGKLLREKFVPQGSLIAILFGAAALGLHAVVSRAYGWSPVQIKIFSPLIVAAVVGIALLVSYLFVHMIASLEKVFTALADRVTIFLYIYLPLGVLGLVVVIIRNLF